MKKLIRYCRERGIDEVVGDVLARNDGMLRIARELGFENSAYGGSRRHAREPETWWRVKLRTAQWSYSYSTRYRQPRVSCNFARGKVMYRRHPLANYGSEFPAER